MRVYLNGAIASVLSSFSVKQVSQFLRWLRRLVGQETLGDLILELMAAAAIDCPVVAVEIDGRRLVGPRDSFVNDESEVSINCDGDG